MTFQNYFKFIDFKKNLKIGMSAVGKQYIVCALLRNILTCLYVNVTSDHFQLEPPAVLRDGPFRGGKCLQRFSFQLSRFT